MQSMPRACHVLELKLCIHSDAMKLVILRLAGNGGFGDNFRKEGTHDGLDW